MAKTATRARSSPPLSRDELYERAQREGVRGLHAVREAGLSDHSAMWAELRMR